jgi:hypothetical protein
MAGEFLAWLNDGEPPPPPPPMAEADDVEKFLTTVKQLDNSTIKNSMNHWWKESGYQVATLTAEQLDTAKAQLEQFQQIAGNGPTPVPDTGPDADAGTAVDAGSGPAPLDDQGEPDIDPYAGMSRDDLAAECETRGLTKSGTKPELLERLRADDAAGLA